MNRQLTIVTKSLLYVLEKMNNVLLKRLLVIISLPRYCFTEEDKISNKQNSGNKSILLDCDNQNTVA